VSHHQVLLVEDDGDIRHALGLLLRKKGYEVIAVENGRQALDHLDSGLRPCLIVLDLMMPVMDGWELHRTMVERGFTIPVVVMSGASDAAESAKTMGAAGCFEKPVEFDALLATVGAHC
jgi:DNA-binding NtrC family response regulator